MNGLGRGPESVLEGVDVDGPLRKLRGMLDAGATVRQVAEYVSEKHGWLPNEPWTILDVASGAERYRSAVAVKDWPEADWTYAEDLHYKDLALFKATIIAEGWARALNVILAEKFSLISTLHRWMNFAEIPSYKDGIFQSRVEADGECRLYKACSMDENTYAKTRPVALIVRIDEDIRRVVKLVSYTALPRPLRSRNERINDGKHLKYAAETECRIPDGTRVPRNTTMKISLQDADPRINMDRLRATCNSLSDVINVSFI